jgi:hypothetical protein
VILSPVPHVSSALIFELDYSYTHYSVEVQFQSMRSLALLVLLHSIVRPSDSPTTHQPTSHLTAPATRLAPCLALIGPPHSTPSRQPGSKKADALAASPLHAAPPSPPATSHRQTTMAPKGKDGAAGKAKGKGKAAGAQETPDKEKKVKGAQQINVRHILVGSRGEEGRRGLTDADG